MKPHILRQTPALARKPAFSWYSDLRLRIVDRYLLRELGSNFLGATFILLLIVVGTAVADLLAKIARGRIPADLLFTLIALRSVDALTVLMPLAVFLGEIAEDTEPSRAARQHQQQERLGNPRRPSGARP